MSSRQLARLQKQKLLYKESVHQGESSNEDSESEEPMANVKRSVFSSSLLDSSSESEPESDSETETDLNRQDSEEVKNEISATKEEAAENNSTKAVGLSQQKKIVTKDSAPIVDDDIEYLNSILALKEAQITSAPDSSEGSFVDRYNLCFEIDDRNLDMDNILRKRFGRTFLQWEHMDPHNNQLQQLQQQRKSAAVKRKTIFCEKKDEWVKPPAFIDGGITIEKYHPANSGNGSSGGESISISYFKIQLSKEYTDLTDKFDRLVTGSGDANKLVLFLWQKPYFIDGLLQLAGIYKRMGRQEQSTDLTRRAVFCLEHCFPEAFRSGITKGLCRVDPTCSANMMLFDALRNYMQLSSLKGCAVTSADLGRLLLGLCPTDHNRLGLLLCLDSFLLQAGKARLSHLVHGFCGMQRVRSDATFNTSFPWANIRWVNAYPVDADVSQNGNWQSGSFSALTLLGQPAEIRATVQLLPNWSFSAALAVKLAEEDKSGTECSDLPPSSDLLLSALLLWPFVLEPLLRTMGIDINSLFGGVAVAEWRPILCHTYFKDAMERVPAGSYLKVVASVYAIRSSSMWNTASNLAWLHSTAQQLLKILDSFEFSDYLNSSFTNYSKRSDSTVLSERQVELYRMVTACPQLCRYALCEPDDFLPEPTRLPIGVEAEIIDPMLDNPELLNNDQRPQGGMRAVLNDMGIRRLAAGRDLLDVLLDGANAIDDDVGHDERHWLEEERFRLQQPSPGQRLNLSRPLLQIFFLSLLPWIIVN